jgi:hypothetical protein
MDSDKKFKLISWAATGLGSVAVFCIVLCAIIRDYGLYGWTNATTISAVVVLLSGAMYLMVHFGAFDIFVYGFSDVFFHMNPSPTKVKKYKDYPDYVTTKKDYRKNHRPYFWPYVAFGGALLTAAIVLRIILKTQVGY